MKRSLLNVTLVLLLAAPVFCQNTLPSNGATAVFEAALASGSRLHVHLRDGDFRIVGTDAEKVSIHVEGKNAALAKHIKVDLKRAQGGAELRLSHVPKNELLVTIEVPRSTSLSACMRGGDLSVEDVTGDKDLKLTGGDLAVKVGKNDDYAQVDLSVRFGDVNGNQFGDPKGWIGNSVHKDGTGKYHLHAHVTAGDLTLKS